MYIYVLVTNKKLLYKKIFYLLKICIEYIYNSFGSNNTGSQLTYEKKTN